MAKCHAHLVDGYSDFIHIFNIFSRGKNKENWFLKNQYS